VCFKDKVEGRFENIRAVLHWISDQQSGEIGFYDVGGPESRTGARCGDGDRAHVETWFR
jgi:hypothetical protein